MRSKLAPVAAHRRSGVLLITVVAAITFFPAHARDTSSSAVTHPKGRFSLPAPVREEPAMALFGAGVLWIATVLRAEG